LLFRFTFFFTSHGFELSATNSPFSLPPFNTLLRCYGNVPSSGRRRSLSLFRQAAKGRPSVSIVLFAHFRRIPQLTFKRSFTFLRNISTDSMHTVYVCRRTIPTLSLFPSLPARHPNVTEVTAEQVAIVGA
jgi:hypothetical protein